MNKEELRSALEAFIASQQESDGDEAQIAEAVKEVTDLDVLFRAWNKTSAGSDPRAKIEAQIAEAVKEVTVENIPPWFKREINNPSGLPWLRRLILKRAKELLSELGD